MRKYVVHFTATASTAVVVQVPTGAGEDEVINRASMDLPVSLCYSCARDYDIGEFDVAEVEEIKDPGR
jgi:hypothetical protein